MQEKFAVTDIAHQIAHRESNINCVGLSDTDTAYLIARLYAKHGFSLVFITDAEKKAERITENIRFFLNNPSVPIIDYPPYNILPYKPLSYHTQTAAKRIKALYQMATGSDASIVVTTIGSVMSNVLPKKALCSYADLILENEEIDVNQLVNKLISGGYSRSAIVEEPGDFSIRGGIFDIFSPLYEHPIRIELFGDFVDSLKFFSSSTQRSLESISEAVILPSSEVLLPDRQLKKIANRIRTRATEISVRASHVRETIARIKNEGSFPGIESLLPAVYPQLDTFFDYLPNHYVYLLHEPKNLQAASEALFEQTRNNYTAAAKNGKICFEPEDMYLNWDIVNTALQQTKPVHIQQLPSHDLLSKKEPYCPVQVKDNSDIQVQLTNQPPGESFLYPLIDWIQSNQQAGHTTLLVCSSGSQAKRLQSLLVSYEIRLDIINGFPEDATGRGSVYISIGHLYGGFVWPDEHVAVITEDELFGKRIHRKPSSVETARKTLLHFEDLKKGDPVVHDDHGIGRFDGLVTLKIDRSTNDYLLVVYRDSDKLYLPVDRMETLHKYLGVDDAEPMLDKMGGGSWQRVKAKVKKSVQKIAGNLLKLYAERRVRKGHAFAEPDRIFKDFESGFPFEETSDQLKVIEEVLADMMDHTPMDRLVCGDVGYGKTEVALRAAFISVMDGKQVAILVPTTVLAEQHYDTFRKRFNRHPITIGCLTRFRSPSRQREIVDAVKTGKTDIVIGTHRLLQKDVAFKDLGLFILDEEQRFGVKHKEKLKEIRKTVDVLALTATPIPRTLHMSLIGARDISIISTPPEYRRPIITYLSEFDDAVIVEAIRRELKRNGQIFFIHNNIKTIQKMSSHIQKLVPEIRIDIAHGRLEEKRLENVMLRFVRGDIDLLICTTIVESGLDIPSANTMIVNRADKFGLAQMYQLRGRIGRSDEQAYAYLFIPDGSLLTKDAKKRLKVLMEHCDLGSGFQIAMNDLKIRGGGTILGASQSGHIASVGYDMFLKLMENTISELKGAPPQEPLDPEISVPVATVISESYVPDIDQRLTIYRRLSRMKTLAEIGDFKLELADRFGPLPEEAGNLLLKIMLKVLASKAGIKKLDITDRHLKLSFSEMHIKNPMTVLQFIASQHPHAQITRDQSLTVRIPPGLPNGLRASKNILKEIIQHVNG